MAPSHRKIPPEEWEHHKATILGLRFDEKLPMKSKNGRSLIQVMLDEHQFLATASQYEAQIKVWGAAKNLKKRDWETIFPVYDELRGQGLKPRVRVGDYIFGENKVKRARREYCKPSDGVREMLVEPGRPSDQTRVWRIEFQQDDGNYTEYCERSEESHPLEDLSISSLIQSDLQEDVPDISNPTPQIDADWALDAISIANTPNNQLANIFSGLNSPRHGLENREDLMSSVLAPYLSPHTLFVDYDMNAPVGTKGNNIWLPFHSRIPSSLGPTTMSLMDEIESIFHKIPEDSLLNPHGHDLPLSSIVDQLVSLPSADFFGKSTVEDPRLVSSGLDSVQEFCARIIYSMLNNFAGIEYDIFSLIFKVIRLVPAIKYHLFQWLYSENSIIAKPLAASLFRKAVEVGDEEVVSTVLKITSGRINEIDVNEIFVYSYGEITTAISIASRSSSVKIVESLLAHGAKVCVPIEKESHPTGTEFYLNGKRFHQLEETSHICALQDMVHCWWLMSNVQNEQNVLQIFKLLISNERERIVELFIKVLHRPGLGSALKSHSEVSGKVFEPNEILQSELKEKHTEVVELFFESIPKERYPELLTYEFEESYGYCSHHPTGVYQGHSQDGKSLPILRYIVWALESEVADKIIKTLTTVRGGAHIEPSDAEEYCDVLKETLLQAILENNVELSDCLMEHTKPDGRHLAAAIRSGRPELIDSILEQGVSACGRVLCFDHMDYGLICNPSRNLSWNSDQPEICFPCPLKWFPTGSRKESSIPTTPLAEAIRLQNPGLINRLENCGALEKINEKEAFHFEAAVWAIGEVGNFSYLKQLLNLDPFLSLRSLMGSIQSAVETNQLETAWDLIIQIPKHNWDDLATEIILLTIVRKGKSEFMEQVLEYMSRFDREMLKTLFVEAVRAGDRRIVEYFLQQGAASFLDSDIDYDQGEDMRFDRLSILGLAIKGRNVELVRLLLELGACPRELQMAVEAADETILHLLLHYGADRADDGAFSKALKIGNSSVLSILLSHFSSRYPNGRKGFGGTALARACLSGDMPILNGLLKAKLDVNSNLRVPYQRSRILPLIICEFERSDARLYQILHQLLDAGADPEAFIPGSWETQTALLAAINSKNLRVVELLLSKGADINRPARRGLKRTPLQEACERGSLWMIEYMLDAGADINAPPAVNGGATAFQLAAIQGNIRVVRLLLDRGAKIHELPAMVHGRTALQGAAEHGRVSVLDLLLVEGAAGYKLGDIESAKKYAAKNRHQGCVDRLNLARLRLGTKAIL